METFSNRIWTETQTNPLAPPEPSEQQCKRISKDWKTPWTSKILRLHYECWFVAELLNKRRVKSTGVPSQLQAQSAFTSVLWSILQGITSISANCFLRGSCGVSETEQACQACVSMAITLSKKISCLDQATIGAKLLAKYSALQNVAHLYKSFHVLQDFFIYFPFGYLEVNWIGPAKHSAMLSHRFLGHWIAVRSLADPYILDPQKGAF